MPSKLNQTSRQPDEAAPRTFPTNIGPSGIVSDNRPDRTRNSSALSVSFAGISKSYDKSPALLPLDLEINAGEFLTLLGPSGSGKSTLLNIAAGYLFPDSGTVRVGERDVTHMLARHRNMGMVFQNYALFPHLSVFENVAYGLRVRGFGKAVIAEKVANALTLVQLEGLERRAIGKLSGGQQQRVALARALVIEPDVLLMDEPLGALDRQLRKHVQLEVRRLHQELGRTTIYVTHDQEEALVMSDRIGVLNEGRLEQVGTPQELYERPATAFVASFLGESNLIHGRITAVDGSTATIDVEDLGVLITGTPSTNFQIGDAAVALIRPEKLSTSRTDGTGLEGTLSEVVYLGELIAMRFSIGTGQDIWCRRLTGSATLDDQRQCLNWSQEDVRILRGAEE